MDKIEVEETTEGKWRVIMKQYKYIIRWCTLTSGWFTKEHTNFKVSCKDARDLVFEGARSIDIVSLDSNGYIHKVHYRLSVCDDNTVQVLVKRNREGLCSIGYNGC